jgi:monothiol glutaredoxin
MTLEPALQERIQSIVDSGPVVLFMKGRPDQPQCGFSARVVQLLDRILPDYQSFDVLSDPEVREGIKSYSDWPTIPQLYVRGEFQGGCDIVTELYESGELHVLLGIERQRPETVGVEVSEQAAELLSGAQAQQGGLPIHLGIDARWRHTLWFAPPDPTDVEVDAGGVTLYLDPDSALRASGLEIDVEQTPQGPQLKIENPHSPGARVNQLTPAELHELRESEAPLRLVDVRTPAERARVKLEDSVLFDEESYRELSELPKDTRLVFYCHTGERSQAAAAQFVLLGFEDVHNLAGGIDAWAQDVDPSLPRY